MNNQNKKAGSFSAIFPPTATDQTIIEQWHAPFLQSVLRIAVVLGLIALIPALLGADSMVIAGLYVVVYLVLVGTTFAPIPYWLRGGIFLTIIYALGVIDLLILGILGDANIFFVSFATMTTLLFSPRAGVGATILTLLTFAITGSLMLTEQIAPGNAQAVKSALADWLSAGVVFTLFSLLIIQALRLLQNDLNNLQQQNKKTLNTLKYQQSELEDRVVLRTKDLEHRSIQLQAVAELGNAITSLRDLDAMLAQATLLISQRFGYYHAGIFLLDEYGEYAVLKSANSEGGRNMLERGHRLKVGETGIVGFVTQTSQARIALDVGQDAVYFDNPDLPGTRSEIALPIVAGGQILGALDVQSTEANAFSEEDSRTLQVLAGQLAVAIQNARLFQQSESALEAARRAYAESSRAAWQKHIRSEEEIGYIATPGSLQPIFSQWNDDLIKTVETGEIKIDDYEQVVNIPVKVRGQAIGALRLRKQEASGPWTKEETALASAFSDQLSSALEAARLYRDAQQRAARESIVSDISSRITASPYTENVLRDTVMELGQAIGNVSVTFQLINESGSGNQGTGPERGGNGSGAHKVENKRVGKEQP
jgi:GAF domain-containing protein